MSRAAVTGVLLMLLPGAAGAADIAAGKAVFQRCLICQTIKAGAGSKVGPDLHGIFGRKAGSADHFAYSEAMRASGIVWNDETLSRFLGNPRKAIPGNRMAFPGIKDDMDLTNLLAYLHQAAQ